MKAADTLSPSGLLRRIEGAACHRSLSSCVLSFLVFMLWVAGSKVNISWPPTMDPSVACRRPKTASPHPPEPSGHDQLKAVQKPGVELVLFTAPPEFEPAGDRLWEVEDPEAARPAGPPRCLLRPRYLLSYLEPQHHLSPPA
jgi:hypothetical protein